MIMAAVETKHALPAKYHKPKNNKIKLLVRIVLARHNHNRGVSPSLAAISRQNTALNPKSIVLIQPKIHNKIPKLRTHDTRLIVNSAINNLIILILKSNVGIAQRRGAL